jgi:hypothetical protein
MGFPSAQLGKIANLLFAAAHLRNARRRARKIGEETRKTQQRGGEKILPARHRLQLVGKHTTSKSDRPIGDIG